MSVIDIKMPDASGPIELLEAMIATFDFTVKGPGGQTLAEDLVQGAVMMIADRSMQGYDPAGNEWKPNAAKYAEYKRNRYHVDKPGELGGQMLSAESLRGRPAIGPESIVMIYGLGEKPSRTTSRKGVDIKSKELEATDRQKAKWFTGGSAGGIRSQPPRPFYALDSQIEGKLADIANQALGEYFVAAGF